jgi:hypothetical protein
MPKKTRKGRTDPAYKRSRLKRVWSKLVDLLGEDDEDLAALRDFLDDIVDGYVDAGAFGGTGKDPRKNGKDSPAQIF